MTMTRKAANCIWYDHGAEDAAKFYTAIEAALAG